SEFQLEPHSDAHFGYAGVVGIGEPAHYVNTNDFKDIGNTSTRLNVGLFVEGVSDVVAIFVHREDQKAVFRTGPVFIVQAAPEHFGGQYLPPVQFFQQGYPVEKEPAKIV